jgi:hypothetical protein
MHSFSLAAALAGITMASPPVLKSQETIWQLTRPTIEPADYDMKGSFYTETTAKGDTPFLIVKT